MHSSSHSNEHVPDIENDDPMNLLRQLIVGPEADKLEHIEHRLDDPTLHAEEVASVLPEAVAIRVEQDPALGQAMFPVVESAIKISVQKDPGTFSNILFPIMGPAIRKSISNALSEMLDSLNQAMENTFTLQGLKWRFESLRTGRSFAEVVMLNSLVYRVEQVFLIHRDTGLLLKHLQADQIQAQDADMVSGMMTAIQDFVGDSFEIGDADLLEEIQVGDLRVWIEAGPKAALAICIRGNAPKSLRTMMQEIVESVHQETAKALDQFQGDASEFDAVEETLAGCLKAKYAEKSDKQDKKRSWFLPVISTALLLGMITWFAWGAYQKQRFEDFLVAIKKMDGVVVLHADHDVYPYEITGMRDPLAADLNAVLSQYGYVEEDIHAQWVAYQSLQDMFIIKRAKQALTPPDGVSLHVHDGVLEASGIASPDWKEQLQLRATMLAGVDRLDVTQLQIHYSDTWILQQANQLIQPPKSVLLSIHQSVLQLRGRAKEAWLLQAQTKLQKDAILKSIPLNITELVIEDSVDYILKQARETLLPPRRVQLSLSKDRVLHARGRANDRWIKQARVKVKTIDGVMGYDDGALINKDADKLLLARIKQLLMPTDSIQLLLRGNQVIARGMTKQAWLAHAKLQMKKQPELQSLTLNTSGLIQTDTVAYLLAQAKKRLSPPDTVRLFMSEDKVLHATGRIDQAWLLHAREIAKAIEGILSYDDSQLFNTDSDTFILKKIKSQLLPPDTVQLKFSSGVLTATGMASRSWLKQAQNKVSGMREVIRFDDHIQPDSKELLQQLRQKLRNIDIHFQRQRTLILPTQKEHVHQVASITKEALSAMQQTGVVLQVVGHSQALALSGHKLAQGRAKVIQQMLWQEGLPHDMVVSDTDRVEKIGVSFHLIKKTKGL